ncbi:MAG TPA: hypothetical protein VI542_34965 [Candidatus Tectomicrobia bacterium]
MRSLASLSRSLGYLICPICDDLYPRGTTCPCRGDRRPPLPHWLRLCAWLAAGLWCVVCWAMVGRVGLWVIDWLGGW